MASHYSCSWITLDVEPVVGGRADEHTRAGGDSAEVGGRNLRDVLPCGNERGPEGPEQLKVCAVLQFRGQGRQQLLGRDGGRGAPHERRCAIPTGDAAKRADPEGRSFAPVDKQDGTPRLDVVAKQSVRSSVEGENLNGARDLIQGLPASPHALDAAGDDACRYDSEEPPAWAAQSRAELDEQ